MTCEEALAALKSGDPIHVSGEEMRRFIEAVAPTVSKDDRDQVIRRATSRVRSTVTAYPTVTQIVCPHKPL